MKTHPRRILFPLCVGIGILAVANPTVAIVTAVIVALTLLSFLGEWLVVNLKLDLFSPNSAFPLAYVCYFLLGTTAFLGVLKEPEGLPVGRIQAYALAGLVSYFVGQLAVARRRAASLTMETPGPQVVRRGRILMMVGIVAVGAILLSSGSIPLLNVAARHGVSTFLTYISYCLLVGAIVVISLRVQQRPKGGKIRTLMIYTVAAGLLLLLAFRTPIIVMSLSLVIYLYCLKRIRLTSLMGVMLALVIFGVIFARYRFAQRYGDAVLTELVATSGLSDSEWELTLGMLYLGFFRTSVASFSRVIAEIPANQPFYHSSALLASFRTILPGKQLSSRELIGVIVTGQNPPPTSYTGTILASPYMDFGVVGIAVFMLGIGALMRYWYERAKCGQSYELLMYSLLSAICIISIHSGLTDPAFLVYMPVLLILVHRLAAIKFVPARDKAE